MTERTFQLTISGLVEIYKRMTGLWWVPYPHEYVLKTDPNTVVQLLRQHNPIRFEFEIQRLQGHAWDHEEIQAR